MTAANGTAYDEAVALVDRAAELGLAWEVDHLGQIRTLMGGVKRCPLAALKLATHNWGVNAFVIQAADYHEQSTPQMTALRAYMLKRLVGGGQ